MNKILLTYVALIFLANLGSQAQETQNIVTEKWQCYAITDYAKATVLVELTRYGEGQRFGEVSVAGVTHRAYFQVAGFNRRWDFGEELNYSFIIHPDGAGGYFDFSAVKDGETTRPSQTFNCVSR